MSTRVRARRAHSLASGLAAAAGLGLLALTSVPATSLALRPALLPDGRWETFANGDDVLALALRGTTLWAGTRAGGLVRWDTVAGTGRQFLRPQDPIAGNTVYDLAVAADGRVWIATDGGLSTLDDRGTEDTADDAWRSYTRASTFGGLPSDEVRAVALSGNLVWVGAEQLWNADTEAWVGGGLGQLDTRGTAETADDVWAPAVTFASTMHEGTDGSRILGLVSDNIADIVVTPQGNLWIATTPQWLFEKPPVSELPARWTRTHGGLSYVDTRGTARTNDDVWTATDCEEMQETVTCSVQALALDAKGSVWAAIAGRGVMSFPVGEAPVIDEPSRVLSLPGGADDDFVDAIAVGPPAVAELANTVWLARRKGGLSVLDHGGTPRRAEDDVWDFDRGAPFTTADGLGCDRVQAVAVDANATWVGTGPLNGVAGGISRLDRVTQTFGAPLTTGNAPPSNFVTDVAFGAEGSRWAGHVWLATGSRVQRRFGIGAVDLDTRGTSSRLDDRWTVHSTVSTDADGKAPWTGVAGDNAQAIVVQRDLVWLGSAEATWDQAALKFADGGLSVFDGATWTARTVANTRQGTTPGLRHGSVSALAVGCAGELWVGTGNGWDFWGAGVDVLTPGASVHERAADRWEGHAYPLMAGNNTTAIAADCAREQVWVAAEHHVTQGDPQTGAPGGDHVGGGVAVFDRQARRWTRYDTRQGLQCYDRSYIDCEATSVTVARDGTVYVGTYGTVDTDTPELVQQHPFYPAVINRRAAGQTTWTSTVFAGAGQVSDLALDDAGRLWAGTTRDGAARFSPRPENWRMDRDRGGLLVLDDGTWRALDIRGSGVPANDISAVGVAPNGDVWLATEGWGLARLRVGEDPPTPTPTDDAPTPTMSATPTATRTATFEATPTVRASVTATATRRATAGTPTPRARTLWLPITAQARRR